MEVKDITNRMVILKARAMGKTSMVKAMKNYEEDWWWEPYLKKFISKLLDSEPPKITGPNFWRVYFLTGGPVYWDKAIKKMMQENNILYRMGR